MPTEDQPAPRAPAYYVAPVADFITISVNEVVGILTTAHGGDIDVTQLDAWRMEIELLHAALAGVPGTLFLEFDIPRLGSRVDAILVAGPAIFPIEFKCGAKRFVLADQHQAWDYALDLKNFHQASHKALILPVLVATDSPRSDPTWMAPHPDGVRPPIMSNGADLGRIIRHGLDLVSGNDLDPAVWGASPYKPTPTIIEAARALYSRHSVRAISRHDAGAKNLAITSATVESVIVGSRERGEKAIVFVTGVPGAGKTLVGLNVATQRRGAGETHAVFLSGNGPLVDVLREALTRDEMRRSPGIRKGVIQQKVKQFIQNVHHFRDEGIRRPDAPDDHVVIFDEAQRAWDLRKTADFMKRRKRISGFAQSEPEFLISYLDRHREWAVVVCLVGGGQEINDGEAGISAWMTAAREKFPNWHLYVSPHLVDSEYAAEQVIHELRDSRVTFDEGLHLSTSMRSFRSENVSAFVKAVLDLDEVAARRLLVDVGPRYPMAITRDLGLAKQWVRDHARGSERFGLVASSEAQRLKPHAIDIRPKVNPIHYFLGERTDTRSSFYLEDAATEFQIQGLELDWTCLAWCADLRLHGDEWSYKAFRGSRWTNVKSRTNQRYLKNAYRVLLTRARQGMVIFVPPGDGADPTRSPTFYDETFEYLRRIGVQAL